MDDQQWLGERFEQHRPHLHAVAYRMLGSLSEADDAVQEAWLRLSRADTTDVENLRAWLTTVVARVSLNLLRSRQSRNEYMVGTRIPDQIVTTEGGAYEPEPEAMLADSVGMAMLIVLETLSPPERFAFVLHDVFAVPFEQIASMLDQTPAAARQLASRARRRIQGTTPELDSNVARQRELIDAFLAAARDGDFARLLQVLHPDVVLRSDAGVVAYGGSRVVHGGQAVARRAHAFARAERIFVPALVNGAAGLVSFDRGRPASVLGFTVSNGKIVEIDVLSDPARLAALALQDFCPPEVR